MFLWFVLIVIVVTVVIQRANILAVIAQIVYANYKPSLGLKIYDIAYKIGKLNFKNSSMYAYINLKNGNIDLADKIYNLIRLTGMKPDQKLALKASHALVYWKRGETDTAIEMLEQVVDDAPSTTSYGSLGYIYICDGQLQKALELNKKAYEFNSDDVIIIENLALTYFKLGEMENARIYYEKLMEKEPMLADCLFEYGQFLAKCGDLQQALKYYKMALDCKFTFMTVVTRNDILNEIDKIEEVL